MSGVFLVVSSFLASTVEGVEALTIVLAAGVTRGWRSTLIGVGVALVVLAVVTAALGPALTLIPIDALRLVVGALLLVFGLQWLRKAILRASGYKGLHDEAAIYEREVAAARGQGTVVRAGLDWYAFTLSFKGVLLEGLEVVFIVVTFGATAHQVPLAALGAAVASCSWCGWHGRATPADPRPRKLAQVCGRAPSHLVRHVLGGGRSGRVMAGNRPGDPRYSRRSGGRVVRLRLHPKRQQPPKNSSGWPDRALHRLVCKFWYDFIIGDDWLIAALVAIALCVLAIVDRSYLWWVLPIVVVVALGISLRRATV